MNNNLLKETEGERNSLKNISKAEFVVLLDEKEKSFLP